MALLTGPYASGLYGVSTKRNDTPECADAASVKRMWKYGETVVAKLSDGIPESVVIGLGVLQGGTVSVAMLVAVFMSNLPEAVASTAGMRAGGWSRVRVFLLWSGIALVCGVASGAGYALLGDASNFVLAFVQAFAGGAILMMLANTMIPEAYERAGKLAGLATIIGFAVAVVVVVLEHTGAG